MLHPGALAFCFTQCWLQFGVFQKAELCEQLRECQAQFDVFQKAKFCEQLQEESGIAHESQATCCMYLVSRNVSLQQAAKTTECFSEPHPF